jgi:uncharacterized ParB-like nuclease family protein
MKKPIERINSKESINKVIATVKGITDAGMCHISAGNTKLDGIKNVSLPPVVTCGANCKECKKYCYAIKSFNRLPVVARAWTENYNLYLNNPAKYFAGIKIATATERVFRWHVSGDIVNGEYLQGMVDIANARPYCEFLAFTKQYNIVNEYIADGGAIPGNLHLIFSASPNVEMPNPHRLPECHINFANGSKNTYTDKFYFTYYCTGNCKECVINGCGCFFLKNGDAVVINQH